LTVPKDLVREREFILTLSCRDTASIVDAVSRALRRHVEHRVRVNGHKMVVGR